MKKLAVCILAVLLAVSTVFAQEEKTKKTFCDVFQASVKGGVSLPFSNPVFQSSHGLSQKYNLNTCVNPEFDFTVAAKLGEFVSLGLGYMDSGTWFAKRDMRGIDTPVLIYDEGSQDYNEYVNTDMYPTRYGTYNCFYGQLGVSVLRWSKFRRVRPIIYARFGLSYNRDYTLLSRPEYSAGDCFDSMEQFRYEVIDQFKYNDTTADKSWSIYTAIGFMLSVNVWQKLSVLVDVRESQFLFTPNQKVNGYYWTDNGVLFANSLQVKGWFSASLGLAWNF